MRALVVEDEEVIAEALRRGLTADGFAVDVADNGTDGFDLALGGPYDVIVLDVMLPGMNGFKVCRSLREAGDHTPIVMLTAKDGMYDEMEALDTGADDYVTKPFRYPVLLSRIRAVLRRSGSPGGGGDDRTDVVGFGDVELDTRARSATAGGTPLDLSPRALAVLEYLLVQHGLVVSKGQILDAVWGDGFDGDPNIVEVYVSRIRAALGAATSDVEVQTVRGAGYRLHLT